MNDDERQALLRECLKALEKRREVDNNGLDNDFSYTGEDDDSSYTSEEDDSSSAGESAAASSLPPLCVLERQVGHVLGDMGPSAEETACAAGGVSAGWTGDVFMCRIEPEPWEHQFKAMEKENLERGERYECGLGDDSWSDEQTYNGDHDDESSKAAWE